MFLSIRNRITGSKVVLAGSLCIFIIGILFIDDYGLSWDEPSEMGSVKFALEHITRGKPMPADLAYYGIVFNVFAEAVFQARELLTSGFDHNPLSEIASVRISQEGQVAAAIRERTRVKHVLTLLAAVVCMAAAGLMANTLAGPAAGLLTIVCLVLMPRFWGHAFFNPKDIPFAAALTLGSWLGWHFATMLQREQGRPINRKIVLTALGMGAYIGLATGVRIGAFFLLGFIPLAQMVARYDLGDWRAWFKKHIPIYLLMGMAWIAVTTAVHPAAWFSPHTWFFKTLVHMSQHSWNSKVLYEGVMIPAHSLPRTYLPHWLSMTIPVGWQLLALLGAGLLLGGMRRLSAAQRTVVMLVLLQLLTMPLIAIVKKSTVYDGMRQFLFVLPMVAVLSAVGFAGAMRLLKHKALRTQFVMLTAGYAVWIVVAMAALHPYEYIYFNAAAGGLEGAGPYYEKDYWGLSLKEAMAWVNTTAPMKSDVLVGGMVFSAQIYARPDLNIEADKIVGNKTIYAPLYTYQQEAEQAQVSPPFYYVAVNRRGYAEKHPDCDIVHRVERKQALLSVVRQCR